MLFMFCQNLAALWVPWSSGARMWGSGDRSTVRVISTVAYINQTNTMDAPSTQKPSSPKMTFKDLMRKSKEAIEILANGPAENQRTESPYHGIYTLWEDAMLYNGKEYSEYHESLRRLHRSGLLIVSFSSSLQGDHETEEKPKHDWNPEARIIPMVYFLIPRGEHSDRFINKLESNMELEVCIWHAKDQFTAGLDGSSDKLLHKNVKGMNFEWRIRNNWTDDPWERSLVQPFQYSPQHDSRVKEFLENDNPYFCVVGMKINWDNYLETDPKWFLKKIEKFDLVGHIEQAMKPAEDGSVQSC
ncbi:hypothetical protein FOXB_17184 [Fusarium oxysporum f. sp. conglutinans Fo5176]|uniref:Uncharacterized protein n=2 Tax=Fusarium oxysporum f. sp. conglutinans TaxID=100902 RepID=F9GEV0_FUSOF|nr:hypothetical protein FOXB_17184 [Fusarium oxysporum f. sp. conglutinans Fo5176]